MELNTVELLDWDTKFFGYPVARIKLDKNGSSHLDDLFLQLDAKNIRVTFFFVSPSDRELNRQLANISGTFVDQKVVFSKAPVCQTEYLNEISEYRNSNLNKCLIDLVLQAGSFSRFRTDKNFKNGEYEKLYIEWLTKSINKTLAFKTFIAKSKAEIIGLTTLGRKSDYADIGLVAVNKDFRGRGIASDLIHFAEDTAFHYGYKEIKVTTQFKNKAACRLYEKCNFKIESITNIYHYWR